MLLRAKIASLTETVLRYEQVDSCSALREMSTALSSAVSDLKDARFEVNQRKLSCTEKNLELKQAHARIARVSNE